MEEATLSVRIRRHQIIQIARTWIGTPYHHQASLRGVGVDCIGLVRGVYRELYGSEAQDVPAYSGDWGDSNGNEDLLEAGRRNLVEIPLEDAGVGDVVALRWVASSVAKHAVILSEDDRMIHAYDRSLVAEVCISDWWRRKMVAAFQFPGVTD